MVVHCAKRKKEASCKQVPESCVWEDDTCKPIKPINPIKPASKQTNKNDLKPIQKVIKTSPIKSEAKSPLAKVSDTKKTDLRTKAVVCNRRKEKGCKEVPDICEWNGTTCVNKIVAKPKSSSPSKPMSKSSSTATSSSSSTASSKKIPTSPQNIQPSAFIKELTSCHCSPTGSKDWSYSETVDLKTPFKEKYDSKVKPKNIHIGQRKLLLSEIQLLTKYYAEHKKDPVLLYVGAAPGTHLLILAKLFPRVQFILYDGAKFDTELHKDPNRFEIHEGPKGGFVYTETIEALRDRFVENKSADRLIFVSDIRLGNDDKNKFEDGVKNDMEMQQTWTTILKPQMGLLKFRMSYNMKHGDKLNYLKGDILYGIWPKITSGETRLLTRKKDASKKIDYDFQAYEETMFFHNKYRRSHCFTNIPANIKNIITQYNKTYHYCPCYDCVAELSVLANYAKLVNIDMELLLKLFHALHDSIKAVKIPEVTTK